MICFGIKTDQEVKEKVTCGSHTNKFKNKKIKQNLRWNSEERERNTERYFFYFFSSLTSLFDIRISDRHNSSGQEAKCSTH